MTTLAPARPSLLGQLGKLLSPRMLLHRLHRESEQWRLVQFRDPGTGFWISRHQVSCSRCGLERTELRSWTKYDPDTNRGYLLADAHRLARSYQGRGQEPAQE